MGICPQHLRQCRTLEETILKMAALLFVGLNLIDVLWILNKKENHQTAFSNPRRFPRTFLVHYYDIDLLI